MSENNLKLIEQTWLRYGKKSDEDVLPQYKSRLPALLQLCGTYQIGQGLPEWWRDLIQELEEKYFSWSAIIKLFRGISVEEFRRGQFQIKIWKECRQLLPENQKKIISSPKIGKFLIEQFGVKHRFTVAFHDRGAKLQKKEVVITADPWDIINMATRGKSWTSCLNFLENDPCYVWENLCDPGMIIVFVRTRGDESDKNIDTRVILRYAMTYRKNRGETLMRGMVIDKFYGDKAYIAGIQKLILKLCKKHGLYLFEYEDYDIGCQMVSMAENKSFTVRGPLAKFPNDSTPYLDYARWAKEKKPKNSYRLEAEVRLIFAPKI